MNKLNQTLSEVLDVEPIASKPRTQLIAVNNVDDDAEFARQNIRELIQKGNDAVEGILHVAKESEHPRAYEVAGQLIKSVADTTDKLIDLQRKLKDVEEETVRTTNNVTNNAVFVGSTSELSKLLKQGFLNNNKD